MTFRISSTSVTSHNISSSFDRRIFALSVGKKIWGGGGGGGGGGGAEADPFQASL